MHPPERSREGKQDDFDPITEGARYGLSRELSLAIWERVCLDATDSAGRHDVEQARRRFHKLAARLAARGGRVRPDVGRGTRVGAEIDGGRQRAPGLDDLAVRVAGRETRGAVEARRWSRLYPEEALPQQSTERSEPPGASEVSRAMTALQAPPQPAQRAPLDATLRARLGPLFGFDLAGIEVVPESPAASGSTKAVTRAGEVHFRPGSYQPGTQHGDWLIAHELAHVVQQRGGRGERPGTRRELEREADRAATLVTRGIAAPIALRAQPAAAYAFDEGEAHDSGGDESAPQPSEAAGGAKSEAGATDRGAAASGGQTATDASDGSSASAAPSAGQEAAAAGDHADDAGGAGLDDVAAVIPAEDSPGGAPSGGGDAAKPQKPAPNVAAATPEAGLAQLHGVRPDRLAALFGQLHGAASTDVAKARATQHANPPKQMSTEDAAAMPEAKPKKAGSPGDAHYDRAGGDPKPGGAPKAGGDHKAGGDPTAGADHAGADATAAKDASDHPIQGDVPGAQAATQAKQREAAKQRDAGTQVIATVQRTIAALFGSFTGGKAAGGGAQGGQMSEAETQQMVGSLDKLPTKANVTTDAGKAPELGKKTEARGTATQGRADLEKKAAAAEAQGRAESAVAMGEDHLESSVPAAELTAPLPAAGAAPVAPLPTLAGAATSEEVGIVAQEQHGAEIDAALSKASSEVTKERGKQAQEEQKAKADADTQVRQLKAKADADQAAARTSAQAEVQQARGQWQSEINKKGTDARKQADKKVAEGMSKVEAEEAKANAEAKRHLDEGRQKADEEKHKGEKEAADAKEKGKSKQSGFWGWVSSKAKAAFDGIKKAVSAAIDACRRAVQAVIAAAKKLAMAAIELARKVVVAVIKAVGEALIAISNVLLAAFPALKAKFQGLIRKAVDKAVATVNKLAEGLNKAVQKALDLLGAALDKALALLEKGIHFVIDAANTVVQGAISAAKAVVDALGTWAKLIKDIVAGPGAWIGKLGAAVVDGIKNHLWSAFKTAVVAWFKSKVFELLGIGGIILELLLEGGMTREDIIQMALDALVVAIPAALVAILIEKLVSMIVPAAGAVMVILEGLQAAWGTISRIIAAFAAFMAFLLAVKSGGAGPLFAAVLASAAVVVLDFVANWLLKKLMSAARKVGAKLKGLAEKFKAKRKAKKDAKAPNTHRDERDGARPKQHHDAHDGQAAKHHGEQQQSEKRAEAQKRLDAARSALTVYLKRPHGRLALKAKLLQLKLRHRLKELSLQVNGNKAQIRGRINPEFIEYADAEVIVSNEELTDQVQSEGLVSFFRSMSLAELKKIVATGRLTTKSNKGKPSSEMMLAEQNFFATHPEGEQGKDLGKGYSIDLIERKGNSRSGNKGYDYAVLVKIDVLRSAKSNVLLNTSYARLHSTTEGNEETLEKQGVKVNEVSSKVAPGERGVVMLKVESNRGTVVNTGGEFKTKVLNYSIRPVDPEGLLEGDPLAEFNKKIYRITLIGGGIGRMEISFL
jgi:hypothetical protein